MTINNIYYPIEELGLHNMSSYALPYIAAVMCIVIGVIMISLIPYILGTLSFVVNCHRYQCYPFGKKQYIQPLSEILIGASIGIFSTLFHNYIYLYSKPYMDSLWSIVIWGIILILICVTLVDVLSFFFCILFFVKKIDLTASCSFCTIPFYTFVINLFYIYIKDYIPLNIPLLLTGIWTILILCAIIRYIMYYQIVLRGSVTRIITYFMRWIDKVRKFFLKGELYSPCYTLMHIILFFVAIFIYLLATSSEVKIPFVVGGSASLAIYAATAVLIYKALRSCRILLFSWLIYASGFSSFAINVTPNFATKVLSEIVLYSIIVFIFSVAWILLALLADDDVAKLAGMIMNTCTTLLLLIINVVHIYITLSNDVTETLLLYSTAVQIFSTVALLPIVMAGHLAMLCKSVQIYWRKKYLDIPKTHGN